MRKLKHIYFVLLLLMLTACSSIKPVQAPTSLESKIQQTRVVLVGESHTDYGHHLNQLAVIKKTHKRWGGASAPLSRTVISIGLEMVQKPFQSYLDDYIAGNVTEIEMLRGVEWYSRWRYDFRLYRPIFAYAKQHKIPLIALNIPQEISRKIAKSGIADLTAEEKKYIPASIDRSNIEYRNRLKKVFGLHAHGKKINLKDFEKFVDAQLAWDEGMALAATKYLTLHPKKRMVILAGSGHLINRDGIPSRIDRQLKLNKQQRSLVILSHSDKPHSQKEADFSLKAKAIKLPAAGQMGIDMKDTDSGVKITSLTKTGAARKAGLRKGDILLAINSDKVKTTSDVYLWLLDKKPNDIIALKIKRNNHLLSKSFPLGKPFSQSR